MKARHRIGALFLAAAVAAGVFSAAPAGAKEYGIKTESFIVKTHFGRIYVEVRRPTNGDKLVKGPAILTYSPYSAIYVTGGQDGRTDGWDDWVKDGYVRVFADVVGTGNSGGCYDYGGKGEKKTGHDIVEWIARQKWSNGKVGMIGGSYEGTTAIATAVTKPKHLTTIIPEAAISRWYEYAYSGGIRYTLNNEFLGHEGAFAASDEGLDTPLAFDFGLAIPPPLDVTDPAWADRVESTIKPCEELEHTQRGYDDTPNYGKFWLERDYIKDAKRIRIPVLISHNWGDWNVKQEEAINFYKALKHSRNKKLFMGTRWEGHGTPGGKYDLAVREWFDHYLMGKKNGAQNMPNVTSQMADHEGTQTWYSGKWPNTTNIKLIAQETPKTNPNDYQWKLLPMKPMTTGFKAPSKAEFISSGANSESHAAHHGRLNHEWFWFETPYLRKDVRIFGQIKLQIWSTVYRKWVTMTPSIIDVDPSEHVMVGSTHVGATDPKALVGVTRGFLDSRYRRSLKKTKPVKPGRPFKMTVKTKPQDYTFDAGHYIGLNVQTEINEWATPKIYPGCESTDQSCAYVRINWENAKTRLILPVVNAPKNPMKLFDLTGHHHH